MASAGLAAEAVWSPVRWHGEEARCSTRGAVHAVVSLARARLIYLGAADGSCNLLDAPRPAVMPATASDSPNWGGHRFWLGPQSRWVWPPPVEWEHAAAVAVDEHDGVLRVEHPRGNSDYPVLVREYEWNGDSLRCTVRWSCDGRPYYGMHVVAVETPFSVAAARVVSPEVPEGLVDVQLGGPVVRGLLEHPAVQAEPDRILLFAGRKTAKCGFAVQPLAIERGAGWRLEMAPGPYEGRVQKSPDMGYLSQVWVGGPEVPLAELEQLTPYLLGDTNGQCSSTVYLKASAPVSVARQ